MSYNDFVTRHEALLETYSVIPTMEASRDFLHKNGSVLLHEHGVSYLLLSALEDEMNGKHDRMKLVSRQSQILTHVTQLAESLRRDPRDVIIPFFKRLEEAEHLQAFTTSTKQFTDRIQARAVVKRKEMMQEQREAALLEAREKGAAAVGPGGLDPLEVLNSLPEEIANAFDSQDVDQLKKALGALPPKEAAAIMKKCVDAGLWVVNNDDGDEDDGEEFAGDEYEGEGDESEEGQELDFEATAATASAAAPPTVAEEKKASSQDLEPID